MYRHHYCRTEAGGLCKLFMLPKGKLEVIRLEFLGDKGAGKREREKTQKLQGFEK